MANGLEIIKTAMVSRNGLMEHATKECGKTVKPVEKESFGTSMEISSKASGRTIRPMDLEYTRILTVPITLGFGRTTCSMAKEKSFGLMEASTLAITN